MTGEQVFAFLSQLGGEVRSTPLGITWGPLRLEMGGGIAGHTDEWWITFPGDEDAHGLHYGPFRKPSELKNWFRETIRFAVSLSEQIRRPMEIRERRGER